MRMIVLALVVLAGVAAPARADVLPQFFGTYGTPISAGGYTLNTAFTFDLRLPGLDALTDFNLDLIVTADGADPGAEHVPLTVQVDRPSDYAFGTTGTLAYVPTEVPSNSQLVVSISGAGAGVSTSAGVNDAIARVTVTPNGDYGGPITLTYGTVNVNALFEGGQPNQPGNSELTLTLNQSSPTENPVPGPGGVVLLGLGGLGLLARGRFGRRDGTCFGR